MNLENVKEYEELCEKIDELYDDRNSSGFVLALLKLKDFSEAGSIEAAEFYAEILAQDGPNHDAAAAYKWYFVSLSAQGYSTDFDDENGSPPSYCGPIGDFRNESVVSDLVSELGFERVALQDSEIKQWISNK